jgi:hypothetical protein
MWSLSLPKGIIRNQISRRLFADEEGDGERGLRYIPFGKLRDQVMI